MREMERIKEHKWTLIMGIITVVVIAAILLAPIDTGPRYSQGTPEEMLEKWMAGFNNNDVEMILSCRMVYFGTQYDSYLNDENFLTWIKDINGTINSIEVTYPEDMNETQIQTCLEQIADDEYAYDVTIQAYCNVCANLTMNNGETQFDDEFRSLCYQINGLWYSSTYDMFEE